MHIRGIILAAGESNRMGRNKLLLTIDGVPLVQRVIYNACKSKLSEVVLVHGMYDIDTNIKKIYNSRFKEGMSTSLAEGIHHYYGQGVLVLLGDMPFINTDIINMIYESFITSDKNIIVPCYNGQRGNPVLIGEKYFNDILSLRGDIGARDIIRKNYDDVYFLEVNDKSILIDIDDVKTYTNYK
jgi:molybdenum cofactor cytidylyltransferase